jgi:hypothetical protein
MFRCPAADLARELRPPGDDLFVHGQMLRIFAVSREQEALGSPPFLIADICVYEVARRHPVTQQATIKIADSVPVTTHLNFPLQQVMWHSRLAHEVTVIV